MFYTASALGREGKVYVSHERVEKMCHEIFHQVLEQNFKPDLLIGISRGGLIPLGLLAGEQMFDLRTTLSLSVESYEKQKQSQIKLLLPLHAEDIAQYKSILVADDIVDSGKTFEFVTSLLKSKLPNAEIKTAALFYKPESSVVQPDFYVEKTDQWIVFPWEAQD